MYLQRENLLTLFHNYDSDSTSMGTQNHLSLGLEFDWLDSFIALELIYMG